MKEFNLRIWSYESKIEGEVKKIEIEKFVVVLFYDIKGNVDDDLVVDGFFFYEFFVIKSFVLVIFCYFLFLKRNNNVDKWVVFGDCCR